MTSDQWLWPNGHPDHPEQEMKNKFFIWNVTNGPYKDALEIPLKEKYRRGKNKEKKVTNS